MRTVFSAAVTAGCLFAASRSAEGQIGLPADPSGLGVYPGYYTDSGAPAYHWPVYSAPVAYGGGPAWGFPGYYGGYRYTYNYYTHVPGVSLTHIHAAYVPRYYPSQWGGIGYYGFGPYPR